MLRGSDGKLQPNALVACQQREKAVRGGGADDLEASRGLERAEGADEVTAGLVESAPEPEKPLAPELRERQQPAVTGRAQRGRRFGAGREALVEERLHLLHELGARQLVGQHRRDADRHRRRHGLGAELLQDLEERKVGVERRLAEPVASVRPPPVIEDVGQVTMECENEVRSGTRHRPVPDHASARL